MIDVEQCKRVIKQYLEYAGTGDFRVGVVSSVTPLEVTISQKLPIGEEQLYVTENCIGLTVNGKELRPAIKTGDSVLLLCRPRRTGGDKYIMLDRVQPYLLKREVMLP